MNNQHSQIHTIQRGESLSKIGNKYGFKDWKPIYNYNTKIHKVLGKDPDFLEEGTKIIIPRTSEDYIRLIKKLQLLKIEMGGMEDRALIELDGNMNDYQFFKEGIDTLSSILTVSVSVGLSGGAKALSSVKRFQSITSKKPLINKIVSQTSDLVNRKGLKGKLLETTLEASNEKFVKEENRSALSNSYKSVKNGFKLGSNGVTVMNCADSLLDFLSPSKVADIWMWSFGETVSETDKRSREMVRKITRNQIKRLNERINELTVERALTYN